MKRKLKKTVLIMASAALMVFAGACSSSPQSGENVAGESTESGGIKEESKASDRQTIRIAVSSASISDTEKLFEDFEKENNCDVEIVVIANNGWADYLTKLQTMMVSGNGPDLFQNPHEGGRMANALGLSAPLDDYIAEHQDVWQEYLNGTLDSLEKAREVDGKIYGLPCFYQTCYMWLNLDRLEAAGLKVPDVNWTWEEFEHYLEVLSQPDKNGKKQYAWAIPDYYFVYNQWLYSFGTGYLNDDYTEVAFDSDPSVELMQFCADAVKAGIAPTPDKNYDYLQQLVDGHVAMTNAGRWMLNYCNENDFQNVAVVRVPQKYSDRQEYAIGNFEVCSSTTKYDLAAACCFYTTGEKWVTQYANDTANIPSRLDVKLTDPTTDHGYVNQDLFDSLPGDAYPMQNPVSFPEISNTFDRYFSAVMAGELSPAEGCKQAAEEMRAALKANPG